MNIFAVTYIVYLNIANTFELEFFRFHQRPGFPQMFYHKTVIIETFGFYQAYNFFMI